jgi:hypothetical protein
MRKQNSKWDYPLAVLIGILSIIAPGTSLTPRLTVNREIISVFTPVPGISLKVQILNVHIHVMPNTTKTRSITLRRKPQRFIGKTEISDVVI